MKIRKANERGHADLGWLKTWHSFSFADYYDPDHMNFGHLRVINDDYIDGGAGFPMHPHRDMEIITYMLEGSLEHKDSMGNGSVIRPGEVQQMTAGTGVFHSEFNPSPTVRTHLLQIWIMPDRAGHLPGYQQKSFSAEEKQGVLRLIVSGDGRAGSLRINQDVDIYASRLDGDESARFTLPGHRKAWLQVASGSVSVNDTVLEAGDAAILEAGSELNFANGHGAEFLLFEMDRAA